MPLNPIKNNSKKISELRQRDVITYHQENSWLPVAQYNSRTGSYHNLAINIEAITGYSFDSSNAYSAYWIDTHRAEDIITYEPQKWLDLKYVGDVTMGENPAEHYSDIGYAIDNSYIAQNIISYSFAYNIDYMGWQFFLGRSPKVRTDVNYLYDELGRPLLTDDGRKIII